MLDTSVDLVSKRNGALSEHLHPNTIDRIPNVNDDVSVSVVVLLEPDRLVVSVDLHRSWRAPPRRLQDDSPEDKIHSLDGSVQRLQHPVKRLSVEYLPIVDGQRDLRRPGIIVRDDNFPALIFQDVLYDISVQVCDLEDEHLLVSMVERHHVSGATSDLQRVHTRNDSRNELIPPL